ISAWIPLFTWMAVVTVSSYRWASETQHLREYLASSSSSCLGVEKFLAEGPEIFHPDYAFHLSIFAQGEKTPQKIMLSHASQCQDPQFRQVIPGVPWELPHLREPGRIFDLTLTGL